MMCQFKMKSYTFCRILAIGLVTCACSHRFAMLSRQWSSNTLKYGIDLLESQCTEPPTRITDLEEMIRAIWINIRNQIAMFFFLIGALGAVLPIKVQEERIRRMQTEMEDEYRAPTELESDSRGDPGSTYPTLHTL